MIGIKFGAIAERNIRGAARPSDVVCAIVDPVTDQNTNGYRDWSSQQITEGNNDGLTYAAE
jgi:hypothetical protein